MKAFLAILICLTLAQLIHVASTIDEAKASFRKGTPRLLKVLNWLVLEKDDNDRKKMNDKTISDFVDFVMSHQDMCVYKANGDTTCEELRKEIDRNKALAGTEGINFDRKMKSIGKVLGRFFGAHDADTVEPYGVLSLLDWALEFGNRRNTRIFGEFPKPSNLNALIKFIIINKNTFWSLIDEGIELTPKNVFKKPDITPLQDYIVNNLFEMGWQSEKPSSEAVRSALQILAASYDLMKKWGKSVF
ncbi:uncharacterized protein LOC141857077 [Brevipalpus obovatus]|uniref:uncharacterized protein LOC141857077 n=1 Tax=Brevipalpus obovatus TaxID=246614 RepID=UPI003D9DC711